MQTVKFNRRKQISDVGAFCREKGFYMQYMLISGQLDEVITIAFYATALRHYVAVWIRGKGYDLCGGGSAGGAGYDSAGAAAEKAFTAAGVQLGRPIAGEGEAAIKEALTAIAQKMGYRKFKIFETHR